MKKSEKMAIGIPIIVVAVLAGIVIVPEIAGYLRKAKQRREDPVIRAVQQGLGEDVTLCNFDSDGDIRYYEYLFNTYNNDVIAQMEATLNKLPKPKNEICVTIYDRFPGGLEPVFWLDNYSCQGKVTEDGEFTYLGICYCERGYHEEFFRNPEIYTALTDIRYLRIEESMQKLAEEAGIDWYEVWPNLETAESYTRGETGDEIYTKIWSRKELESNSVITAIQKELGEDVTLCDYNIDTGYYEYLLNTCEKNAIVQLQVTLDNLPGKPQNEICVAIYDPYLPGARQAVFELRNCSWQGKMTEDGKFAFLEIYDPPCRGNNMDFYQNPEIYTALSAIRYLRVSGSMQELAEEAGIDWYEAWPKLELAESYRRGDLGKAVYTKIWSREEKEIYTEIWSREEVESNPIITAIQEGMGEDVTLCDYNIDTGYYEYLLDTCEINVIARLEVTLNHLPDKPQNEIRVAIYDPYLPGARQAVFELRNCSWQGERTKDGKFTCLEIYDPPCRGYHTDFFLDPVIYTVLSDIRYLRISEPMQELAEEAGIDWYEVWPKLESAEVYSWGETGDKIIKKICAMINIVLSTGWLYAYDETLVFSRITA